MDQILEIYHDLRRLGFCTTQDDFSVQFLGKSPGYLAYIKSSGANVSMTALRLLAERIKSITPTSDDSRWHEERAVLRSLTIAAQVMLEGEFELRYLAPWQRTVAL